MSTFAPLQFLKSAQNPLVWTAVDNGTDTRTSLIIYYGAVNTLPADTGMYEVNCIMMHQAEKQLYANTGTTTTPNWEAFGPNSAFPQPLVPGSFLFTDGVTVYWATQLVGQIQYNASNLNQYGILNFNSLLVASNDVPNSRINVDLDVVSLASNTTFVNSLLANTSFISGISTALLALSSFITNLITTLLANTTFISGITNIVNTSSSTSINLGTQVTGTLGLSNGGTGASLTDPNYDAVWVWDDTTNATRLANISGLTYDSGTNTLTASGGGTGTALETTVSQTGHGLSVGDVIKVSGTNTFAKAQGDSEVNSEAVGVVTTVVNANSFKYVSSAIQLAYAPVGAPGSAVWLSPTVAGGMTTTKPSTIGQVARALGTIIESGVTMYFDIAALAEVIGNGGSSSMINNPTYFDDFLTIFSTESTTNNLKIVGALNFIASASSPSYPDVFGVDAEANHPGIIQLGTNPGGSAASFQLFQGGQSAQSYPIQNILNNANEYQFIVKPVIIGGSANYDITITRDGSNGYIQVRFNGSTGNIQLKTDNGATTTTTTVASYTLGNWYNFIVKINGASVELYQAGVLVATNTTNLPTAGIGTISVGTSNGACGYIDYFAMKIANLTR